MGKIKIFLSDLSITVLENEVNNFIKDKIVMSIQYQMTGTGIQRSYSVLIAYKDTGDEKGV